MLRFLSVRHLALIDELEVEFEPGLNLITGETGAGKSIIVGAIDLLVGGRASADLVRTGESTATVQAVFEHPDGREVIVRREISTAGRSRAFLDDTLATSAALKDHGAKLLDLHGQHEHQTLLEPAEHLAHLDAFMRNDALVDRVADAFDRWQSAAAALQRSQIDGRERALRIEMASFQLQEIDRASPQAGEEQQLLDERNVLSNVDRLSRWSQEAYAALYEGDDAVMPALAHVWKRIGDLAGLDARFSAHLEARPAISSGLEDLAFFLRTYAANLEASPQRLQFVEDRLATLDRLKKRFGPSIDDVLAKQQELRGELEALTGGGGRLSALETDERNTRHAYETDAAALTTARTAAAAELGRRLARVLADLAMPQARVDVRLRASTDPGRWTRRGQDDVEMLFSANPGEELRPLARIASGGELSRVLLGLRTLSGKAVNGQTLLFDEVDAGIGGSAADAVGERLQTLARHGQVICITHLPQIAARAAAHYRVEKQVRRGRTVTALTRLDLEGRVQEIGRMIAGSAMSAAVLASARDLLATRGESEQKAKGESAPTRQAKGRAR